MTLAFKTGTFVMPLIEDKFGIGFCRRLSGHTLRPLREIFQAMAQRNRNVRNASL
jgi:hypothetical protein